MPRRIPVAGDMTEIGEAKTPPFARVPRPARLFERRAKRFRQLSGPDGIGPYLAFLGGIAEAQTELAETLGEPEAPDEERISRAIEHGMPPLDRSGFRPDPKFRSLNEQLFGAIEKIDKPAAAQAALASARGADDARMATMVADLMADSVPVESVAEHAYVAAALQLHFARAASMLPERRLKPVGDGACPACGGPPVSSVIVGWPQAGGARFCSCALCGTLWHHVRIKCAICSSTKGIRYQEIADGPGTIKAETCDECGRYVKIFNQQKDVSLDPFADDVGSLGIDLLMRETRFRRGAFNPFLLGY
ncbi:formate dehydrogenase accessory protein FdhE [Aquamicrobium sp. LC103]|uniref:formate dehydrogenase accessory protein FdhE n=1 Tax=Aquamicrobium sp. LC103 TaxID=1120658 RepID=UPI00063EA4F5|nr:formate dehydrogenase accessory protein FdhE [Aquamicrobium sp. LC103]TKT69099.1 formate dehydrogenase accessory protein FdhE [Aquamicrobium sp. LC103]